MAFAFVRSLSFLLLCFALLPLRAADASNVAVIGIGLVGISSLQPLVPLDVPDRTALIAKLQNTCREHLQRACTPTEMGEWKNFNDADADAWIEKLAKSDEAIINAVTSSFWAVVGRAPTDREIHSWMKNWLNAKVGRFEIARFFQGDDHWKIATAILRFQALMRRPPDANELQALVAGNSTEQIVEGSEYEHAAFQLRHDLLSLFRLHFHRDPTPEEFDDFCNEYMSIPGPNPFTQMQALYPAAGPRRD